MLGSPVPAYASVALLLMLRGSGEIQVYYWVERGTDGSVLVPGYHLFPSSCWSHPPQSKQGMCVASLPCCITILMQLAQLCHFRAAVFKSTSLHA